MIQEELLDDGKLVRHYSDDNKIILQVETGIEYSDALDVVPCPYTYEETEKEIEVYDPDAEASGSTEGDIVDGTDPLADEGADPLAEETAETDADGTVSEETTTAAE